MKQKVYIKVPVSEKPEKSIYHCRIELQLPDPEHHPMFSFYNVKANDKQEAGEKARKQFCEDFGGKLGNAKVGYVWDTGIHVDLKQRPAI